MSFLFVPRVPRPGQRRRTKGSSGHGHAHDAEPPGDTLALHSHGGHQQHHASLDKTDDAEVASKGKTHLPKEEGSSGLLKEMQRPFFERADSHVLHYSIAKADYDAGGPLTLALLQRSHATAL